MTYKRNDPVAVGERAMANGVPKTDNPFVKDSSEWAAWNEGWDEGAFYGGWQSANVFEKAESPERPQEPRQRIWIDPTTLKSGHGYIYPINPDHADFDSPFIEYRRVSTDGQLPAQLNEGAMRCAKRIQDAVNDDPRMLDDQVALAGIVADELLRVSQPNQDQGKDAQNLASVSIETAAEAADGDDDGLRRWQDTIRERVITKSGAPDHSIDGAGCDSGDPLDLTLAEIDQGFNFIDNEFYDTINESRPGFQWPEGKSAVQVALELLRVSQPTDTVETHCGLCGSEDVLILFGIAHKQCMRIATANTVEAALAELREMAPNSGFTSISHDCVVWPAASNKPAWKWVVIVASKAFYGATLSEAMQKVREFAKNRGTITEPAERIERSAES